MHANIVNLPILTMSVGVPIKRRHPMQHFADEYSIPM